MRLWVARPPRPAAAALVRSGARLLIMELMGPGRQPDGRRAAELGREEGKNRPRGLRAHLGMEGHVVADCIDGDEPLRDRTSDRIRGNRRQAAAGWGLHLRIHAGGVRGYGIGAGARGRRF